MRIFVVSKGKKDMTKKEFTKQIGKDDTSIIVGMSFKTNESATCWATLDRKEFATRKDWIDAAYKQYQFQNKRNLPYLDVRVVRDCTIIKNQ